VPAGQSVSDNVVRPYAWTQKSAVEQVNFSKGIFGRPAPGCVIAQDQIEGQPVDDCGICPNSIVFVFGAATGQTVTPDALPAVVAGTER